MSELPTAGSHCKLHNGPSCTISLTVDKKISFILPIHHKITGTWSHVLAKQFQHICSYAVQEIFPYEKAKLPPCCSFTSQDLGLNGKINSLFLSLRGALFHSQHLRQLKFISPKRPSPTNPKNKKPNKLLVWFIIFLCNGHCRTVHFHRRKTDIWK